VNRDELPFPGDCLLHPLPMAAALLILVNDMWLKPQWPHSFVTGKLSDVGINFLLPVVLLAAFELVAWLLGRRSLTPLGRPWIVAASFMSAGYFTLLKTVPAFTAIHAAALSLVARPFVADFTVKNATDPADLATLAMTLLAAFYLDRRPEMSRMRLQ
jgi:hypothetical protein